MNKIEKIECTRQLVDRKKKLELELADLKEKMFQNQSECEHVSVIMKAIDSFPAYGCVYRCLFCGCYLSNVTEFYVDARNYLTETYDYRDKVQCEEKFDIFQTKALEILNENPNMSIDEFVNIMNNFLAEEKTENVQKRILTSDNLDNPFYQNTFF